jgi:threonine dehydrogenase-like Zn-dependent dehydrogenase
MLSLRYENGSLALKDVAAQRRAGEALVRVRLAGICNTDLEIARGYANFQGTPGHEFVGEVVEAPEQYAALTGRRVVGEINAGCGLCELCLAGDARHCAGRTVLGIVGRDGAFAEYLSLPASNLLPVPDEIPDERAVFAEPLAAACGVVERVNIAGGARAVVVGDGKLGLLCAQALAALTKARVALVGKHDAKLAIAARRGVDTFKLAELGDSERRAFDVAVEASGSPAGLRTALSLLRPRGTLVLKSTFHGTTEIDFAPVVVDEIGIVGSRCGRFAPALDMLGNESVDVESLITETHALRDALHAMRRAAEPGVLKVLLKIGR